jgi:hypothetical protein
MASSATEQAISTRYMGSGVGANIREVPEGQIWAPVIMVHDVTVREHPYEL